MSDVILVTGASSGIGRLSVIALAEAGHTVYAGIRDTSSRNAPAVDSLHALAIERRQALRTIELNVMSQASADAAIAGILDAEGRLDVVVHNAGHMALGPAESFTPQQFAELYDVNVLGAQRVNRAALPFLRARGAGLLVWIGSSSSRGGCPPFLAPYFAAKAGLDALAVSYAGELIRFGIDTTIVVPGAFTSGTSHFSHAGQPGDPERAAAYDRSYGELLAQLPNRLGALIPPEADVARVANEVVRVVDLPAGERPFRVHVDPSRDGAEVVAAVADRIRSEFFHRVGLSDLLAQQSSL